jgi:poly-gamma-glutamate synthesis protein (capsule biosynthesis protein)
MRVVGAGRGLAAAQTPAILDVGSAARILVVSFGLESSGIPREWLAGEHRPGVNLLPNLSDAAVQRVARTVAAHRRAGDVIVASVHWGSNWGYMVPMEQRRFAHRMIDAAGVHVVHGHSSHHVKGIEVYRNQLILYGCGDFLTDYEGISGYKEFRGDLALMYFARIDTYSGHLLSLRLAPLQARRMRLTNPSALDVAWLQGMLNRECARFGARVDRRDNDLLELQWGSKAKGRNGPLSSIAMPAWHSVRHLPTHYSSRFGKSQDTPAAP